LISTRFCSSKMHFKAKVYPGKLFLRDKDYQREYVKSKRIIY